MSTWNRKHGRLRTVGHGFTLLELLVAMAITAILLSLIFAPVVQSFNLTNRARTQVQSQTGARTTMDLITRLLSNAVFVYDNGQTPLNLWVRDENGDQRVVSSLYTMVEYVSPARQQDQVPGNIPIDPTTGQPIYGPTLTASQSGFAVPLALGRTVGRVFNALLNNATQAHTPAGGDTQQNGMPKTPYTNRFEDPANSSQDNRYALYRAEVVAYVPNTSNFLPDPKNPNGTKYVPDLRLFHTYDPSDPNNPNAAKADTTDGTLRLDDPNFFYDNSLAGGKEPGAGDPAKYAVPGWKDLNGDGKVEIGENWRAVSSPIMAVDKIDTVSLDRDPNTNAILYYKNNQTSTDPTAMPTVRPLITFAPTFLQNDPGVPTSLESTAFESPSPAPTAYTSQETHWAQPFRVLIYRNNVDATSDPLSLTTLEYYQYQITGNATTDGKIYHYTATNQQNPTQVEAFDVGPDPDPLTGFWKNSNVQYAFTVDPQRGIINFDFPASVLVNDGTNPLPQSYSPEDINNNLTGTTYGKRYLDLRATLSTATWNGVALNPASAVSPLQKFGVTLGQMSQVSIVPGSERVYGPDQRPGPNYGYRTLYTRVSANAGVIGLNQYKINYQDVPNATAVQDQNDPRVRMGYIEFNSQPDGDLPNVPPGTVGSNGLPIIGTNSLPIYKWNPNLNPPGIDTSMSADSVQVTYDFQMNRANDVVKIDYLTRAMMNIGVEARFYDPASSRPQVTDLTSKIRIRNLQR
jgi:prepilin-type N-terminal cleavage/methylation domain-containing protein